MNNKEKIYQDIVLSLDSILKEEKFLSLHLSTILSLLKNSLDYIYWVGFYIKDPEKDSLFVGPYQGTLACLHIPFGKGVCGEAAVLQKSIIVDDVHSYANHIACDSKSLSEIVLPVFNDKNELFAVLDVDSDRLASFDLIDQKYLELILDKFVRLKFSFLKMI